MNDSILKALMQLFALVVDIQDNTNVSKINRTIVGNYLKSLLNKDLANYYLVYFDKYVTEFYGNIDTSDSKKVKKKVSLKAVKVLKICEQINQELTQEQKFIVLIQLLEFVCNANQIEEIELEFLQMVADSFNIDENEYNLLRHFVQNELNTISDSNSMIVIGDGEQIKNKNNFHPLNQLLNGRIIILRLKSINAYYLKYLGQDILYLNNQVVDENKIYVLGSGSSIKASKINPIYYTDIVSYFFQSGNFQNFTYVAENVEFKFKNSENGIQKFNFSETAGKLIGVMGGSGVGKSTLLNILIGNLKPLKGSIYINGFDLYKEKNELKGVIGYVPQDDLLIEELSVYQNLYFTAKLCFKGKSETELEDMVNSALEQLELFTIKDLKVGNSLNKFISGGQRKRLNIALELIRKPTILFVDEPTSGLSSMDSQMVMDLLKELTINGKLVIVNIHQPSSEIYKMFDKLLILDKGGYLVYNGNPMDAVIYFKKQVNYANSEESSCDKCGNVNPEKVLEIIESKVVNEYGKLTKTRKISPLEWSERFENNTKETFENKHSERLSFPENGFKKQGLFKQFLIFVKRDILCKLTNRQYLLISFIEAPLLAFILGYFTKYIDGNTYIFSKNENLPSYLFMSVVVALFIGLSIAAEEIIKDRRIRKREAFLNLSYFSYINSKLLILFLISAIQTLTFVLLGNLILGIKGMTLSYWLILFTASCFSNILGLLISSAFNSVVTIYILIPFILVPQLLFSGVIVKFEKLHKAIASDKYVSVLGDVMISRWAYEALAVTQFKDNEYQKFTFENESKMSRYSYFYSYLIPELQNRINDIETAENDSVRSVLIEKNIKILYDNLSILSNFNNQTYFADLKFINKKDFKNEVAENSKLYLDKLLQYFIQKYNNEVVKRDNVLAKLDKLYLDKGGVNFLKNTYFNESLNDLLRNKTEVDKIIEKNGYLIQQIDPVFKKPESNSGRAHFYASYKYLFGFKIDTFVFNLMLIWMVSFLIYLFLLFDSLRKIIDFVSGNSYSKYN